MSPTIKNLILAMTKHMSPQGREKMIKEMEEWPIVKRNLGLDTHEFDDYRFEDFERPENDSRLDW